MKKVLTFVALSFAFAPNARAQASALPGEAASEFSIGVARGIYFMKPVDPFQNPQCQVVDAHFFAPVDLKQAQHLLAPCLSGISQKYGVPVSAKAGNLISKKAFTAQVQILLFNVSRPLPITHPLIRDINYGLAKRSGRILGIQTQVHLPGRFDPSRPTPSL